MKVNRPAWMILGVLALILAMAPASQAQLNSNQATVALNATLAESLTVTAGPGTVSFILPGLVSGSVLIEIVLSLQTVGPVLLRATLSQDMFLAGSIVLILSSLTVIGALIGDIALVLVDPRIRFGKVSK